MPLQAREFVGTIDAAPAEVPRGSGRWTESGRTRTLASIQYEVVDGSRVWEVGSYAYRPEGFLGAWQYHVRLTPTQNGRTRLWAHYERSAWRYPVRHYNGEGWDADRGEGDRIHVRERRPLRSERSGSGAGRDEVISLAPTSRRSPAPRRRRSQ